MDKTNYKIHLLLISLVLLLLLISAGASFAYFTANISGSEEGTTLTVTGGSMKISYTGSGSAINITHAFPQDNVLDTKTFTVTGNNTTDLNMFYNLSLVVSANTFTSEALKYKLISTNTGNNGSPAESNIGMGTITTGASTIILGNGNFAGKTNGNKTHTYNLAFYFPNTGLPQNEDQNKEFKAYVDIKEGNINHSKTLTIDHSKIDETLTNYPVMVKLDNSNFDFTQVRPDGKDLKFTETSGTLLDFEVEYFNKEEQLGVYHVRIPSVSSTLNTRFNCHYGYGTDFSYSNKHGVWDSNYLMVHHMGESLEDSTVYANNLTNSLTAVVNSLNGHGRTFSGGQYLHIPIQEWNTNTIQMIAYKDMWYGSYENIFYSGNGPSWNSIKLAFMRMSTTDSLIMQLSNGSTSTTNLLSISLPLKKYNFISGSFNGVNASLSINSETVNNSTVIKPSGTITETVLGGAGSSGTYPLKGTILDELRISNIVRSDAWIKADDHNLRQNNLITIN